MEFKSKLNVKNILILMYSIIQLTMIYLKLFVYKSWPIEVDLFPTLLIFYCLVIFIIVIICIIICLASEDDPDFDPCE